VWMTAVFATALNPVAVPIMVGAWFAYAAFVACLGLWFSMVCRTTLRAIVWTLISGIIFFLGHWLVWLLFIPLFLRRMPDGMEWLLKFQVGLTPPFAMGFCFPIFFFEHDNQAFMRRNEWVELFVFGLIGVCIWALAAAILWGIVSARFRAMTNRTRYGIVRPAPTPHRPHRPRLRSEVRSRNGTVALPVEEATSIEIVEALPALDEEAILDVLRAEDAPGKSSE
jgi:hypothetical protein